jgi:hypothetical protein
MIDGLNDQIQRETAEQEEADASTRSVITLEEARTILNGAIRTECRDHAFGDREVYWYTEDQIARIDSEDPEGVEWGDEVGGGYFGQGGSTVWIGETTFNGADAYELVKCGQRAQIGRNDTTGDDQYRGA